MEDFYNESELGVGNPPPAQNSANPPGAEDEEETTPQSYSYDIGDLGDLEDLMDDDSDDDGGVFSAEERMRGFADSVLSACIKGGDTGKYATDKLMTTASPALFRDENHILFAVLFAYRAKLRFLRIDEEFLRLFLGRNRNMLNKAGDYIDLHAYGEVDGSYELGYLSGVLKHYRRLMGMPEQSVPEFETNFEKYLVEFKAIEATKAYRVAQQILTEGVRVGRKFYSGFDDSNSYLKKRLAEIEGLVDFGKGQGFINMRDVLMAEEDDNRKSVKIGDFDTLTALNDVYGGIYTSMFYQFIAPPKAGKTKLCTRICHTLVVRYGTNVTVWAQEGGHKAWSAQMRAIHFDHVYNTGMSLQEMRFGVDQNCIMKNAFQTEELRQLEMSSKLDLASNPDYGSVDYIDRPFNVETFLEDIDTSVKANNSRAVIIDYLQLIESSTGMNSVERISEAYKKLLRYCKKNNVAVITPGQYKQEAFDEMLKKSDISEADLRTAGGGSSEVERTPDVLLALWASASDLRNNTMHIIPMPSRMNVTFPPVKVCMDLGTCRFISVDE